MLPQDYPQCRFIGEIAMHRKNVLLSCAAAACLTVASNASATDSLNEFKHIVVIY
jgi:hypothetical protein